MTGGVDRLFAFALPRCRRRRRRERQRQRRPPKAIRPLSPRPPPPPPPQTKKTVKTKITQPTQMAWTPLFFKEHKLDAALADSAAMLGFGVAATLAMAKAAGGKTVVPLMAPYLAWVAFATALNGELLRLNPDVSLWCGRRGLGARVRVRLCLGVFAGAHPCRPPRPCLGDSTNPPPPPPPPPHALIPLPTRRPFNPTNEHKTNNSKRSSTTRSSRARSAAPPRARARRPARRGPRSAAPPARLASRWAGPRARRASRWAGP